MNQPRARSQWTLRNGQEVTCVFNRRLNNLHEPNGLEPYGTNYLIDTKTAIIVDVEATPARWSAEVAATKSC